MVLKSVFLSMIVVFSVIAGAVDLKPYHKALALQRAKRNDEALDLLVRSYRFEQKQVPLNVSSLALTLALSRKDWKVAERIADSTLRSQWPGWPPADSTESAIDKKLKSMPEDFFSVVESGAEAKSHRLVSTTEHLSEEERTRLESEIKLTMEVLAQIGRDTQRSQSVADRLQDRDEFSSKEEYNFGLALTLSYWTWEDRPSFSGNQSSHAILYTPCLGLVLQYPNAFYEWSGGGCMGLGRGDVKFSDGHYDNHASLTWLSGFGSLIAPLSDSAGFGVEAGLMSPIIRAKTADGQRVTSENEQATVMAIGRFRPSRLEIKFKAGTALSNNSAIWAVELSYPLYR